MDLFIFIRILFYLKYHYSAHFAFEIDATFYSVRQDSRSVKQQMHRLTKKAREKL